MEYTVLAVFVASMITAFITIQVQAFEANRPLFENLQNSVIGSSNGETSSLLGDTNKYNRFNDINMSLEKQNIELEDIKESLENLQHGVGARVGVHPLSTVLTLSEMDEVLRKALLGKGLSNDEMDEIFKDEMHKLQSQLTPFGKRGRSRFSVQTRFAPFGTKLVPNRKLENGGATLLRYGRSVQSP